MSLVITSLSAPTEPVTTAEVMARLRLTSSNDESLIGQLITVAREFAEKVTRRALVYQSYAYTLDRFPFPNEPLRLPVPPLIALSSVTFYDSTLTEQTWAPDDYWVADQQSPALVIPIPGIIYPPTAHVPGAVTVNFTAGFGYPGAAASGDIAAIPAGPVIPQHLAEGIRKLAMHLYEHPEAVTSDGLKESPVGFSTLFAANKIYVF